MNNVTAVNNTGGNVALSLTNFYVHTSSKIHIMDSVIDGGRANTGGGIRVWTKRGSIHIAVVIVTHTVLFLQLEVQTLASIQL